MGTRESKRDIDNEAIVLTKATIRVADRLEIPQKVLALVVGLSESTVSRMQRGSFVFDRDKGKTFEFALLLLQLYELLDRMACSDLASMRAWMTAENSALEGRPIDLIQRAQGLVQAVSYLRTRLSE
jgi:hypothetical protein